MASLKNKKRISSLFKVALCRGILWCSLFCSVWGSVFTGSVAMANEACDQSISPRVVIHQAPAGDPIRNTDQGTLMLWMFQMEGIALEQSGTLTLESDIPSWLEVVPEAWRYGYNTNVWTQGWSISGGKLRKTYTGIGQQYALLRVRQGYSMGAINPSQIQSTFTYDYSGICSGSRAGDSTVIWESDCGDSSKQFPEQCDRGSQNGNGISSCSHSCTLEAECGNGITESWGGEQCDKGTQNGAFGSGCSISCKTFSQCGNGIEEPWGSEECDEGSARNGTPDSRCSSSCQDKRSCQDLQSTTGITLEKSYTGNTLHPGDYFSYTLRLQNSSQLQLDDFLANFPIDDRFEYRFTSPGSGQIQSGQWKGSLPRYSTSNGSTITAYFKVKNTATAGTISGIRSTATHQYYDTSQNQNVGCSTEQLSSNTLPSLTIAYDCAAFANYIRLNIQRLGAGVVVPGDTVEYAFNIENRSSKPISLQNYQLEIPLGTKLEKDPSYSYTSGGWTAQTVGTKLHLRGPGTIAPGGSISKTVGLRVKANHPDGLLSPGQAKVTFSGDCTGEKGAYMPTITVENPAVTSLSLQANPDLFSLDMEDVLALNSSIIRPQSDFLANDQPGGIQPGAAVTLSTAGTTSRGGVPVSFVTTSVGGTPQYAFQYKILDSPTFLSRVEALGPGEAIQDTFSYTIEQVLDPGEFFAGGASANQATGQVTFTIRNNTIAPASLGPQNDTFTLSVDDIIALSQPLTKYQADFLANDQVRTDVRPGGEFQLVTTPTTSTLGVPVSFIETTHNGTSQYAFQYQANNHAALLSRIANMAPGEVLEDTFSYTIEQVLEPGQTFASGAAQNQSTATIKLKIQDTRCPHNTVYVDGSIKNEAETQTLDLLSPGQKVWYHGEVTHAGSSDFTDTQIVILLDQGWTLDTSRTIEGPTGFAMTQLWEGTKRKIIFHHDQSNFQNGNTLPWKIPLVIKSTATNDTVGITASVSGSGPTCDLDTGPLDQNIGNSMPVFCAGEGWDFQFPYTNALGASKRSLGSALTLSSRYINQFQNTDIEEVAMDIWYNSAHFSVEDIRIREYQNVQSPVLSFRQQEVTPGHIVLSDFTWEASGNPYTISRFSGPAIDLDLRVTKSSEAIGEISDIGFKISGKGASECVTQYDRTLASVEIEDWPACPSSVPHIGDDVIITQEAVWGTMRRGEIVGYKRTITNNSSTDLKDVRLSVGVPPQYSVVTELGWEIEGFERENTTPDWLASTTIIFTGDLDARDSIDLDLPIRIKETANTGTTSTLSMTLTAAQECRFQKTITSGNIFIEEGPQRQEPDPDRVCDISFDIPGDLREIIGPRSNHPIVRSGESFVAQRTIVNEGTEDLEDVSLYVKPYTFLIFDPNKDFEIEGFEKRVEPRRVRHQSASGWVTVDHDNVIFSGGTIKAGERLTLSFPFRLRDNLPESTLNLLGMGPNPNTWPGTVAEIHIQGDREKCHFYGQLEDLLLRPFVDQGEPDPEPDPDPEQCSLEGGMTVDQGTLTNTRGEVAILARGEEVQYTRTVKNDTEGAWTDARIEVDLGDDLQALEDSIYWQWPVGSIKEVSSDGGTVAFRGVSLAPGEETRIVLPLKVSAAANLGETVAPSFSVQTTVGSCTLDQTSEAGPAFEIIEDDNWCPRNIDIIEHHVTPRVFGREALRPGDALLQQVKLRNRHEEVFSDMQFVLDMDARWEIDPTGAGIEDFVSSVSPDGEIVLTGGAIGAALGTSFGLLTVDIPLRLKADAAVGALEPFTVTVMAQSDGTECEVGTASQAELDWPVEPTPNVDPSIGPAVRIQQEAEGLSGSRVRPGGTVDLILMAENTGSVDLTGVRLVSEVSLPLEFRDDAGEVLGVEWVDGGAIAANQITVNDRTISIEVGTLPIQSTARIRLKTRLDPNAASMPVRNRFSIHTDQDDSLKVEVSDPE